MFSEEISQLVVAEFWGKGDLFFSFILAIYSSNIDAQPLFFSSW